MVSNCTFRQNITTSSPSDLSGDLSRFSSCDIFYFVFFLLFKFLPFLLVNSLLITPCWTVLEPLPFEKVFSTAVLLWWYTIRPFPKELLIKHKIQFSGSSENWKFQFLNFRFTVFGYPNVSRTNVQYFNFGPNHAVNFVIGSMNGTFVYETWEYNLVFYQNTQWFPSADSWSLSLVK